MKIAVVIPTRGMVYTQVEQYWEEERRNYDVKFYRSWDLPIPEGHNQLTQMALTGGADYVLYNEEDVVPPPGALEQLLVCNADIACIDYGVAGWGCVTSNPSGTILWCGLGCTLVKRKIFEGLEFPYFRVDKQLRLNDWKWLDLPGDYIKNKNYGSLDIWFCTQARKAGFTIKQVEGECEHLQLEQLGEKGKNHGLHKISVRPKIIYKQVLSERG